MASVLQLSGDVKNLIRFTSVITKILMVLIARARRRHVDQPRQGVVATALELHRALDAKLDAIAAKLRA